MQKIDNSKYINNFLQKIRAEDGLSKNTILSYGKDLELLEIFLQSKKISFENCTKEILKKYFSEDAQQDLKNSSVSRKISCFKHFFKNECEVKIYCRYIIFLIDFLGWRLPTGLGHLNQDFQIQLVYAL